MKKIILFGMLTAACTANCYAQSEAPVEPKVKKYDQYVGVQINNLIRQVINFNNNTAATPLNPYLLTYSINSRNSGWGLRLGVGYNYSAVTTNDGITQAETKINDLQVRLGIEKRYLLSAKWSAGVGLDGLYNLNDDYTRSVVHSFDTVTTVNKSNFPSYGGGVMGWLRYDITPHIVIGTEASFYYITGKESNSVLVTSRRPTSTPPFSVTTSQETKSNPTNSTGVFRSPVVFFLMVKF